MFKVFSFYATDPENIPEMLEKFFEMNPDIVDVKSINTFTLAVQKNSHISSFAGSPAVPQMEYQFHYVIVYEI